MKSSPLDTFCRALVLGGLLGALGWGAIRYTDLPQMALAQLNTWNTAASSAHSVNSLHPESATASASSIPSVTLPQLAVAATGASQSTNQSHLHPTQQAAYLEAAPIPQPTSSVALTTPDIREGIERRLCDLGAVYSLLEMWGHDSFQYRYHCRVAISNNRQVTRSFEANGSSPEDAMQQVLQAVEGFQSTGRLQTLQVH